eukprot:4865304-Amphidinium_carterae.1
MSSIIWSLEGSSQKNVLTSATVESMAGPLYHPAGGQAKTSFAASADTSARSGTYNMLRNIVNCYCVSASM